MMLLKLSVATLCIFFCLDGINAANPQAGVHFAIKDPSETDTEPSEHSEFELPESRKGNMFPPKEKPQPTEDNEPKQEEETRRDSERPEGETRRDPERPEGETRRDSDREGETRRDSEREGETRRDSEREGETRRDSEREGETRRDPERSEGETRRDSETTQPRDEPRPDHPEGEYPVGVPVNHQEFNSRLQNMRLNYEIACTGHGCQNGGRCTTEFSLPGRAYGCNCGSKLGGPLCEIVDPCKNNPCPEGALCLPTSALDSDCGRKCYNRRTGEHLRIRC